MIRSIDVNWDDPCDLKKKITFLQKRRKNILRNLGYDEIYFNGSKYNIGSILPVLNQMFELDISLLYETEHTDNKYYVYAHCNPFKPLDVKNNIKHLFLASKFPALRYEPFYIGKGKDSRYLDLNRNDSHRKIRQGIEKFGKVVDVKILLSGLTNKNSLCYESKLIDILGLKCYSQHGLLVNLDEGIENEKRRSMYEGEVSRKILKRNGFKFMAS